MSYTGKVIAGIYTDRTHNLLPKRSGQTFVTAETAKLLGICDANGTIPPSIRSLKFLLPSVLIGKYPYIPQFIKSMLMTAVPDVLLPMSVMADGAPQN